MGETTGGNNDGDNKKTAKKKLFDNKAVITQASATEGGSKDKHNAKNAGSNGPKTGEKDGKLDRAGLAPPTDKDDRINKLKEELARLQGKTKNDTTKKGATTKSWAEIDEETDDEDENGNNDDEAKSAKANDHTMEKTDGWKDEIEEPNGWKEDIIMVDEATSTDDNETKPIAKKHLNTGRGRGGGRGGRGGRGRGRGPASTPPRKNHTVETVEEEDEEDEEDDYDDASNRFSPLANKKKNTNTKEQVEADGDTVMTQEDETAGYTTVNRKKAKAPAQNPTDNMQDASKLLQAALENKEKREKQTNSKPKEKKSKKEDKGTNPDGFIESLHSRIMIAQYNQHMMTKRLELDEATVDEPQAQVLRFKLLALLNSPDHQEYPLTQNIRTVLEYMKEADETLVVKHNDGNPLELEELRNINRQREPIHLLHYGKQPTELCK